MVRAEVTRDSAGNLLGIKLVGPNGSALIKYEDWAARRVEELAAQRYAIHYRCFPVLKAYLSLERPQEVIEIDAESVYISADMKKEVAFIKETADTLRPFGVDVEQLEEELKRLEAMLF